MDYKNCKYGRLKHIHMLAELKWKVILKNAS